MKTITVKCPKCHEMMEIDAQSGTVLRHHAEVKPRPGSDFLGARLRDLEQEKARREELVAQGREKERTKQNQFQELFKKVKETGAKGKAERPIRDIDID